MSSPIHDVSDTAFWIAHHRAMESARPDALFADPFAALLAGERGRRISEAMPTSRIVAWSVALRTRIIDDYIASAIAAGIDTVLNLGAGLDARPYRMELPPTLRWIEADYAHMIDYKHSQLAGHVPHCRLERVAIDLALSAPRRELLRRVDAQSSRGLLILTEGVVPYLSNEDAGALAKDLRSMQHSQYWIVDYFTAQALKMRRRRRVSRAMQNAPFRFAPGDWVAFFGAHGWSVREIRFFLNEAQRFNRPVPLSMPLKLTMRLAAAIMPRARRESLRQSTGYALLERAA